MYLQYSPPALGSWAATTTWGSPRRQMPGSQRRTRLSSTAAARHCVLSSCPALEPSSSPFSAVQSPTPMPGYRDSHREPHTRAAGCPVPSGISSRPAPEGPVALREPVVVCKGGNEGRIVAPCQFHSECSTHSGGCREGQRVSQGQRGQVWRRSRA